MDVMLPCVSPIIYDDSFAFESSSDCTSTSSIETYYSPKKTVNVCHARCVVHSQLLISPSSSALRAVLAIDSGFYY